MDRVMIIAEAGVNHNGDLGLAKEMVLKAKEAGADYVKFQTAIPELVISRYAEMAEYQKANTGTVESQLEMCKRLHLRLDDYGTLKGFCEEVGIKFGSTPFDLVSIGVLDRLNVDFIKIPSGEVTNLPYLRAVNSCGRAVILSTGMSSLGEIDAALKVLKDCDVTLLHCTTEYPCPMDAVNLRAMLTLRKAFGRPVGYSDHTQGIEIPIAAVAMGANVIEKHFTLDRNMPGPDHKASLEPLELKAMVDAIRNVELSLGTGVKVPAECEKKNIAIARRSIVAACKIPRGAVFTEQNLGVKRPGTGISPMCWDEVIGRTAKRDFKEDELIEL